MYVTGWGVVDQTVLIAWMQMTYSPAYMIGIGIIVFVLGFASGFITARRAKENDAGDVRIRLAAFIVIVWAVSVMASIIIAEYETSIWVHAIMGGVSGYLFGIENPLTGGSNG